MIPFALVWAFSLIPDGPLPDGAVARLGSTRWRIKSDFFCFSPDGRSVVSLDYENDQLTWTDVVSGRVRRRLKGPCRFDNFGFLADGRTLWTLDRPREPPRVAPEGVRYWDAVTLAPKHFLPLPS